MTTRTSLTLLLSAVACFAAVPVAQADATLLARSNYTETADGSLLPWAPSVNAAVLGMRILDGRLYIVGDFSGRRDAGDGTVFCYPQVMMTATKRGGGIGWAAGRSFAQG